MYSPRPLVAIVGPGVVGTALGRLLHQAGYPIGAIVGRTIDAAGRAAAFVGGGNPRSTLDCGEAGIVLLTTPDAAIAGVARELASRGSIGSGCLVLHASGFLSSAELEPLRAHHARLATLHPLQSFAAPDVAVRGFPGTFCFFEGDADAVDEVATIIQAIGGRPVRLERDGKALYHAAASVASNFLVAILSMARTLMQGSGVGGDEGMEALLPLVRGTLANIERVGIPAALTGPIERGDVAVVAGHLHAITDRFPDLLPVYRALARETLDLARRKGGIATQAAAQLERLLAEGGA